MTLTSKATVAVPRAVERHGVLAADVGEDRVLVEHLAGLELERETHHMLQCLQHNYREQKRPPCVKVQMRQPPIQLMQQQLMRQPPYILCMQQQLMRQLPYASGRVLGAAHCSTQTATANRDGYLNEEAGPPGPGCLLCHLIKQLPSARRCRLQLPVHIRPSGSYISQT